MPKKSGVLDIENTLLLAESALDQGDPNHTLDLCYSVIERVGEYPDAFILMAEAFRDLGMMDDGEVYYRRVTQLQGDRSIAWSGLGSVLFDQLDFEQCLLALQRAIRTDPENADAYFIRSMIRERHGDEPGAWRDCQRAFRLDPEGYPLPEKLSHDEVHQLFWEAASVLQAPTRTFLSRVNIVIEDYPDLEVLGQWDPPAPPGRLLGYFAGYSLLNRPSNVPWTNLPSIIVLYKYNLQRAYWNREFLLQELRQSILSEVSAFLGIKEDFYQEATSK